MTDKSVGQAIRRLRLEAKYGLRDFAKMIGISAAYLSDIEHDRRVPTEDVLRNIATNLNRRVPVTYDALRRLSARLETDIQQLVQQTPEVGQLLREVRDSGRPASEVIRELQEHLRKQREVDE